MRKRVFFSALFVCALAGMTVGVPPAQATNDPGFKKQWGLQDLGGPAAWTKTAGNGITVAVVDSGADLNHPDLKAKLVPGYDFGDNDDNPNDDSLADRGHGPVRGHGTHVSGIVGAATDNGIGVAGTAPFAKIMPLKVWPTNKSALDFDPGAVAQAIRYAVNHGAKVINLSLGGETGLSLVGFIETPCAEAYSRGALCVVAAGNSGQNKPSGYAHDVQFLNVTAHDKNGVHADFAQKADTQWSVSAPGVEIYSTWPTDMGGYATEQGTSMAAPHAAGVAALLFAQGLSVGQVVQRILGSATPMGDPGTNGAGRINAAAAVGAAVAATTTTVAATANTQPRTRSTVGTTDDPFSGTHTTLGTVPSDVNDDELAFSGGPGNNTQLDPAAHRRPAQKVPLSTMLLTLAIIGVLGGAWGGASFVRHRGA